MRAASLRLLRGLRVIGPRAWANAMLNVVESGLGVIRPLSRPLTVDVVLTRACNLRCVFCIAYGSTGERLSLPFDVLERIAEELFPTALGVHFCSGGEPFLYPRIREALKLVQKYRTRAMVVTNGMALDNAVCRWLIEDQSVGELGLSFDAARPETLRRIRRGADYDLILRQLAELAKLKRQAGVGFPHIKQRFSIMKMNAEELVEVVPIAARHGVEQIEVDYVNTTGEIPFEDSLFHDPELARSVFSRARDLAAACGIEISLPPLPVPSDRGGHCEFPWRFVQVDVDGTLRFCYEAWRQRLGSFEEGFDAVWRGSAYAKLRASIESEEPYFPYCRSCGVRCGKGVPSAHDQRISAEGRVIQGLERWQVPFCDRARLNASALRDLRDGRR